MKSLKSSLTHRQSLRLLCSIGIFAIVFVVLGFAVDSIWFREDDLGTILGGIIRGWSDVVRVFSADCRSFITPANYQRTEPNVISGFLRPMQNVVFSLIYFFWGVDARAYYLVHVAIHAANASLLFVLLSYWLPISLSCFAGFMLAFYPSVSWLPWIGTMQNSLAVFFLLLTVMVFARMSGRQVLVGLLFLASLLSRETTILLPFWFALGAYLFDSHNLNFWRRVRSALIITWPLFAATIIYFLMRLASFGVATLPRTLHNLTIRFPWLAPYLGKYAHTVVSSAAGASAPARSVPVAIATATSTADRPHFLWQALDGVIGRLTSWLDSFFNLPVLGGQHHALVLCALTVLLIIFFWFAYRGQRRVLLWLSFGLLCTLWPGVVAYPSTRYLNTSYPFLVALVVIGIYCAWQQRTRWLRLSAGLVCAGALALTVTGLFENRASLHGAAAERVTYKKRFDDFFTRYHFPANAHFVLLSSPFVSDIQHIFQAFLGNLNTVVAFDPFCTLAERGVMGCRQDYRTVAVGSRVDKNMSGSLFRLTSVDPAHCGWWLRFSDYPIRWVHKTRSYEWTTEPYRPGRWYPCSIGKFFIHAMACDDCVADVTFVIDPRWVTTDTVFVAWNTTNGCYEVVAG